MSLRGAGRNRFTILVNEIQLCAPATFQIREFAMTFSSTPYMLNCSRHVASTKIALSVACDWAGRHAATAGRVVIEGIASGQTLHDHHEGPSGVESKHSRESRVQCLL